MTPSIIRRFARYHHLDAMLDAPIDDSLATIERLCVLHFGSCDALDLTRIVQTLTRIEDAEMLLRRVEDVPPGPASRGAKLANSVHQQAAYDLLCLADIDPFKWLEVKE